MCKGNHKHCLFDEIQLKFTLEKLIAMGGKMFVDSSAFVSKESVNKMNISTYRIFYISIAYFIIESLNMSDFSIM